MLWLPKITLDLLTTEELLLYDNFKRNVEFNFWKQLGMKEWNRVTIVVTVLVQVTKQCKHCNNQTCCSHLIKWDSKWVPKCCTRSSQSYLDNIYHILSSDVSSYNTVCSKVSKLQLILHYMKYNVLHENILAFTGPNQKVQPAFFQKFGTWR